MSLSIALGMLYRELVCNRRKILSIALFLIQKKSWGMRVVCFGLILETLLGYQFWLDKAESLKIAYLKWADCSVHATKAYRPVPNPKYCFCLHKDLVNYPKLLSSLRLSHEWINAEVILQSFVCGSKRQEEACHWIEMTVYIICLVFTAFL